MTEKRLREIVDRFLVAAESDHDGGAAIRADFCRHIKRFFDEMAEDDYFGTEEQAHPFGDKRN